MNKILFFLSAVLWWGGTTAQPLRFDSGGQFRIAQFTDMHLDPSTPRRAAEAEKTFARLDRVLASEHPDLVVFTGDVVTGAPAEGMWTRLLDTMARRGVPFCVVLGNHDAEQDLTRQQIARLVTGSPMSLNTLDDRGELADRELEIRGSASPEPAALVYCLDSHDYSTVEGIEGYGWFTPEQVAWFRASASARAEANGGRMQPALAFFHIVLPEYLPAWRNRSNTHIGRAAEDECPGALNTGMFAAMAASGGLMGTFVGHDHDIDYLVAEKGVAMGYGRYSGDDTTYNNLRPGARILLLGEGVRGFDTWIVEDDGRTVDRARFADGKITHLER
ncbi:metallophosphoesterase family protein [Alistipes sp.]|uniref:metallophosphoesterase family protein n=1 Tax=Alistipes sp. TaxID=1872444 RepID=UPI003AF19222